MEHAFLSLFDWLSALAPLAVLVAIPWLVAHPDRVVDSLDRAIGGPDPSGEEIARARAAREAESIGGACCATRPAEDRPRPGL